jgi:hypothetical protein
LAAKRALKPASDRLLAHVAARCAPLRIDPALAASRGDAESFVQALAEGRAASHPLACGWRQHVLADFA